MVHTNLEFENFEFDSRLEFDQHLGSHKHVINIIMWFRDMGCYNGLAWHLHCGCTEPFDMCRHIPSRYSGWHGVRTPFRGV
jgi:hypothetical protein